MSCIVVNMVFALDHDTDEYQLEAPSTEVAINIRNITADTFVIATFADGASFSYSFILYLEGA